MALQRKNLMVDPAQLTALATRRGISESAAVREAVAAALFAEEFGAALDALQATGYGAAGETAQPATNHQPARSSSAT